MIGGETGLFAPISHGTVPLGLSGWAPPTLQLTSNLYISSYPTPVSVSVATKIMTKSKSRRGGGAKRASGEQGGGAQARRKSQSGQLPTGSTKAAGASATPTTTTPTMMKPRTVARKMDAAPQDDDTGICWVCAEPVKYYSISECNHRTCYVCALRLRALYKKQECIFCKVRLSHIHKRFD